VPKENLLDELKKGVAFAPDFLNGGCVIIAVRRTSARLWGTQCRLP